MHRARASACSLLEKFTRFINENKLKHFSCSSKYMSVRRNGRDKDTDFFIKRSVHRLNLGIVAADKFTDYLCLKNTDNYFVSSSANE